jgi:hypothetical protein
MLFLAPAGLSRQRAKLIRALPMPSLFSISGE